MIFTHAHVLNLQLTRLAELLYETGTWMESDKTFSRTLSNLVMHACFCPGLQMCVNFTLSCCAKEMFL